MNACLLIIKHRKEVFKSTALGERSADIKVKKSESKCHSTGIQSFKKFSCDVISLVGEMYEDYYHSAYQLLFNGGGGE